jgi:hypothetical protein
VPNAPKSKKEENLSADEHGFRRIKSKKPFVFTFGSSADK